MDIENLQPDRYFALDPSLPFFFSIIDSVNTNSQFEKRILRAFSNRTRFPVHDNVVDRYKLQ